MSGLAAYRKSWFFLLTFCMLTFTFIGQAQYKHCKLLVDSSVTLINGHSNAAMVRGGDTICLKKGIKTFLLLSYMHGTKTDPIIIQNADGLVTITGGSNYGVKFDSCSYIKLSGTGISALQHGIKIDQFIGAGLSVDGLSTDIEIEGLEIGNVGLAGIFAKTDPNCSFTSTRDKYTLRNLSIHDNYIHHTGMEGMYIGSSKYAGQVITCGGRDTTVLPHLLKGVKVYRNLVQEAGWDGIQVSSTDSACTIHDNVILNDSKLAITYQMSGILIGGGTNASVFNNRITDGLGDGIDVISFGKQYIYNNLIINPGKAYKPTQNYTPWLKHGIYVGPEYTSPGNSCMIVFNTIISPKSYGVRFTDNQSTGNVIANNIIVDPGSYQTLQEQAYINLSPATIDVTLFKNLTTRDINYPGFLDPGLKIFDLKSTSPAVNNALPVAGFDLSYDHINRPRPFAVSYDIGAYECSDSSLLDTPEHGNLTDLKLVISPNPFTDQCDVAYQLIHSTDITIRLLDDQGRMVMLRRSALQPPGKYQFIIYRESLKPGVYSLIFQTDYSAVTRKLIILNN